MTITGKVIEAAQGASQTVDMPYDSRTVPVTLEIDPTSGADTIVSSDADILVLHPWRGGRILQPADDLAETERNA